MVNLLFCFESLLHKFACTLYLEEFIMMVTFYLVSCLVKWCHFIFRSLVRILGYISGDYVV